MTVSRWRPAGRCWRGEEWSDTRTTATFWMPYSSCSGCFGGGIVRPKRDRYDFGFSLKQQYYSSVS